MSGAASRRSREGPSRERVDECLRERLDERLGERLRERLRGRLLECHGECPRERLDERLRELLREHPRETVIVEEGAGAARAGDEQNSAAAHAKVHRRQSFHKDVLRGKLEELRLAR